MRSRLGIAIALLLSFACEDPRLPEAHAQGTQLGVAAQRARSEPEFQPPDASGYGRAAGLRYLERCLGPCQPDAPQPMVILIHGLGDRPRPDWLPSADSIATPVRLVMPEAPTPYHDGFAWFPYRFGHNDPERLGRGIAAAADQLARAIGVLRAQRPTRGLPFVTGFSQGGMLSFALALRHPEQVGLSVPMAGMLPEPLWPKAKPAGKRFPRIVALHGDADSIVPIAPDRGLVAHLAKLGYAVELREYPGIDHTVSRQMEAAMVERLTSYAAEAAAR